MDMEKLRKAHAQELREAGLAADLTVLPERLVRARAEYLHLLSKSNFLNGLAARIDPKKVSPATYARIRKVALLETCRAEGASLMLDTLGIRLDTRA